jgi:hypothetical protein
MAGKGGLTPEERRFLAAVDETKPAPEGWVVLLRSDDPTGWNTQSAAPKLAIPLTEAHLTIKHLRTAGQFQNGARLLGIAQGPAIKKAPAAGTVIVIKKAFYVLGGSGFAGKIRTRDDQFYSWKGKEIPKTAFEIAVTCNPLTKEEEALLVK